MSEQPPTQTPSLPIYDPDLIMPTEEDGYDDDGRDEVISDEDLSVLSKTEGDFDRDVYKEGEGSKGEGENR